MYDTGDGWKNHGLVGGKKRDYLWNWNTLLRIKQPKGSSCLVQVMPTSQSESDVFECVPVLRKSNMEMNAAGYTKSNMKKKRNNKNKNCILAGWRPLVTNKPDENTDGIVGDPITWVQISNSITLFSCFTYSVSSIITFHQWHMGHSKFTQMVDIPSKHILPHSTKMEYIKVHKFTHYSSRFHYWWWLLNLEGVFGDAARPKRGKLVERYRIITRMFTSKDIPTNVGRYIAVFYWLEGEEE